MKSDWSKDQDIDFRGGDNHPDARYEQFAQWFDVYKVCEEFQMDYPLKQTQNML